MPTSYQTVARAPGVARFLEISWIKTGWPTQENDGYGQSTAPLSALVTAGSNEKRAAIVLLAGRPIADEKKAAKELKKMFGNEDFLLASKYFDCYRIDATKVEAELLKPYVNKLPAVLFLDVKGEVVHRVAGRVTAKRLVSGAKKLFKGEYGRSMSRQIKVIDAHLKLQEKNEDRIANARKLIQGLVDRLAKKDSKRTRTRLVERQAEMAAALEEKKKLMKKRQELLRLDRKGRAVAKGA